MNYEDAKKKIRVLSGSEQDRMVDNGWTIIVPEYVQPADGEEYGHKEYDDELFERCSKYFDKVKLYQSTTRIRGYYKTFAMCK